MAEMKPYMEVTVIQMTMRQWYKGMALMGLMNTPGSVGINSITITKCSARMADFMLAEDAERERSKEGKDER